MEWDQANLNADYFIFLTHQFDPCKGTSSIPSGFHWVAVSISHRMSKAVEFYNSLAPVRMMPLDLCTHRLHAYE